MRQIITQTLFLATWASTTLAALDLAALRDGAIVLDANAIESEAYAAEEFQRFFEQASGVTLPIVTGGAGDKTLVYIGAGESLAASSLARAADREYGQEESRILISSDGVVIAGGRPRGVLYGVYRFLEDYLDVRFLTADVTHVPPFPLRKRVKDVDSTYDPPFEFRFYLKPEVIDSKAFTVRRRQNGHNPHSTNNIPESMGGTSPAKFFLHNNMGYHGGGFEEHPEYYTLSEGIRRSDQPCLSHPDVRRQVWADIERHAPNYSEGYIIPLAQNDANHGCNCPRCQVIRNEGDPPEVVAEIFSLEAIEERFGRKSALGMISLPTAGPFSVNQVSFVNHLAERLEPLRPDVRIGTMAYSHTMMPPRKTRVRDNVIIQFATYQACIIHGLTDSSCKSNLNSADYLEGWGKVCDYITAWYYDHNHHDVLSVVPNLNLQADNLRFFVENNVRGMFTQGTPRNCGFSDLRAYWLTALHWDPGQDSDTLIDEFLGLYYGEEPGKLIRKWLDLVHAGVDRSIHTNIGYQPWHIGLDPALGDRGIRLFDKAMAAAENQEIRDRIEKVSATAWRLACEPVFWNTYWAQMTSKARKLPLDDVAYGFSASEKTRLREKCRRLFELCRKHEINQSREGFLVKHSESGIRKYFKLGKDEEL